MPFRFDCPRCRQPLLVPRKKTGSQVSCPKCKTSFWVPEDMPLDQSIPELPGDEVVAWTPGVAAVPPPPPGPPAPTVAQSLRASTVLPVRNTVTVIPPTPPAPPMPPLPTSAAASPLKTASGVHAASIVVPPAAVPPMPPTATAHPVSAIPIAAIRPQPAPTPPTRKVARLITAESAQSMIQPAADGKLPELRLVEGQRADTAKKTGKSVSPIVLVAVLCMSVGLSVAMVFLGSGDGDDSELAARKVQTRQAVAEEYFSSLDNKGQAPYQTYLREAKLAHSRGDFEDEREWYRKVLGLLREERSQLQRSLTGSQARDKKLEEYISTLLSEQ